ncbi:MAG: TrkA C-terminal domain-containing protein [Candidatus Margulisiibacteriota bacterium]|jgi:hypothetical protein
MEIFAVILAVFIISEIATVLLTFTGLDRDTAKFQAISALTGTGFTTREAEQMLENRQRRQIISALMIIGQAGVILLIAGVFHQYQNNIFTINLLWYLAVIYVIYKIVTSQKFSFWFRKWLESLLTKSGKLKKRRIEELLKLDDGFGVAELDVGIHSEYDGKNIASLGFREMDILILSVERGGKVWSLPKSDYVIEKGDVLTCYAKLHNLRKVSKTLY